jgi:surface protein
MITKSRFIFVLCTSFFILFSACQDTVNSELEDSLDLSRGLDPIPEAQRSTVTINRGTDASADGYLKIFVENVSENPLIASGSYEAWCLEWNKSLRSSGDVHDDVSWFSTSSNDAWNPINYFFTIREQLQADDPLLSFLDLQAILWVVAGEMSIAPEFDVLNMPTAQFPSRLRSGENLAINRNKVANIARRVLEEAPDASVPFAGIIAKTAPDEQDIYVPPTQLQDDSFVTIWDTNLGPGATVSLALDGDVDATIDWGDGTVSNVNTPGPHSHQYSIDGIYTVSVFGSVTQYNGLTTGSNDVEKLISVLSWGELGFQNMDFAFSQAVNLISVPVTSLGLANVTSMRAMFAGAESFDSDIGSWNTSNVRDMTLMFYESSSFNQNLSSWNVQFICSEPSGFDDGADAWTQPKPDWEAVCINP